MTLCHDLANPSRAALFGHVNRALACSVPVRRFADRDSPDGAREKDTKDPGDTSGLPWCSQTAAHRTAPTVRTTSDKADRNPTQS